jgi:hypothetical protein
MACEGLRLLVLAPPSCIVAGRGKGLGNGDLGLGAEGILMVFKEREAGSYCAAGCLVGQGECCLGRVKD